MMCAVWLARMPCVGLCGENLNLYLQYVPGEKVKSYPEVWSD